LHFGTRNQSIYTIETTKARNNQFGTILRVFTENPKNTESRNEREIERGITNGTDGCARFELLFLILRFRAIRSPGVVSLSLSRCLSLLAETKEKREGVGAQERKGRRGKTMLFFTIIIFLIF